MASTLEKQLLLPFLAPSAFRQPQITRRAATVSQHCTQQPQWQSRSFRTTIPRREEQQQQTQRQNSSSDEISSLLDETLDFDKGVPTASTGRTSHFQSKTAQHSNPPSRGASDTLSGKWTPRPGSSVDDLFQAMKSPSSNRTNSNNRPADDLFDLTNMLDPAGRNKPTQKRLGPAGVPLVPEKTLPMKLNASVGRTVRVDAEKGMDSARAFRMLEVQCARNSVKRDAGRQRFHERPGLKRKRLRSERWKRRFREGFRGVVGLVMRMKRQGW